MTASQRIALKRSETRQRLAEIGELEGDDYTPEIRDEEKKLQREFRSLETRYRSALIAETAQAAEQRFKNDDGEGRELRSLLRRVRLAEYIDAARQGREVREAEAEFNQATGMTKPNGFPLRLLAPETRATTDTDAKASQKSWLQRVFAESASSHLGVTHESVSPGAATFPVVTSPSSVTSAQRGRTEAAADAAWTTGVTRLEPTRNAIRQIFSVEDDMRLPGLEAALRRDMSMALREKIDRTIFLGDDGASGTSADITGFVGASITEQTITQANKVKGPQTLAAFLASVDGVYASRSEDLNVVAAVGANTLWCQTIHTTAASTETIKGFLNNGGVRWMVRGGIESDTANDDFGAFIGRNRGIAGSAVSALWSEGMLIRDIYTGASKGEVALTLSYLWAFGIPRTANFQRLKFVT